MTRTERLDLGDDATAERLLAVQHAAYAVEAALIGDDRIPPVREDLAGLRAAAVHWLGALDGGELLGAVAWSEPGDPAVDVERLVVDPRHHRRGVGRALVTELLRATSGPVVVSTGRDNGPACRLYASLGFVPAGDAEVLPGLWVRRFSLAREATSSTSWPSRSSR